MELVGCLAPRSAPPLLEGSGTGWTPVAMAVPSDSPFTNVSVHSGPDRLLFASASTSPRRARAWMPMVSRLSRVTDVGAAANIPGRRHVAPFPQPSWASASTVLRRDTWPPSATPRHVVYAAGAWDTALVTARVATIGSSGVTAEGGGLGLAAVTSLPVMLLILAAPATKG